MLNLYFSEVKVIIRLKWTQGRDPRTAALGNLIKIDIIKSNWVDLAISWENA